MAQDWGGKYKVKWLKWFRYSANMFLLVLVYVIHCEYLLYKLSKNFVGLVLQTICERRSMKFGAVVKDNMAEQCRKFNRISTTGCPLP